MNYKSKSLNISQKATYKEIIEDVLCGFFIKLLQLNKEKSKNLIKQATEVILGRVMIELAGAGNRETPEEVGKVVIKTTTAFLEDFLQNLNSSLSEEEKKVLLRKAVEKITRKSLAPTPERTNKIRG